MAKRAPARNSRPCFSLGGIPDDRPRYSRPGPGHGPARQRPASPPGCRVAGRPGRHEAARPRRPRSALRARPCTRCTSCAPNPKVSTIHDLQKWATQKFPRRAGASAQVAQVFGAHSTPWLLPPRCKRPVRLRRTLRLGRSSCACAVPGLSRPQPLGHLRDRPVPMAPVGVV